jgi:two-component sensor histidine kinase
VCSSDLYIKDITERKRAEERLRDSLKEKSVLLKEIHHRVKNNMQVISSLLSLQGERIENGELRHLFRDSQLRIRSMALVHEKLYQSESLARIDFAEYVNSLASRMYRSFGEHHVTWHGSDEKLFLSADIALPCGLIVNELISNALKHAFPDKREGRVFFELSSGQSNQCRLVIRDNGIGLPSDFNIRRSSSLGMQLVDSLVSQIGGTIELSNHEGTRWSITFPLDLENSIA